MTKIDTFITQARQKGLTDEKIRAALATQGWDDSIIDMGLAGIEVPTVENKTTHPTTKRPTLSPLMAALHHVLLWFFTGSSTVTIIGVIASLSGVSVSAQALAAMIAVTLVTFTPYAILFLFYLIQARKNPGLIPGKVWSIITICLDSIGAMAAAITLVITLVLGGEWSVSTGAALILTLNLIIIATYCLAAFGADRLRLLRKIVLISYLPTLFILFGALFSMSLLKLGPAQHDEQIRKDLATAATSIREHTRSEKKLPADAKNLSIPQSVTYHKKTDTTYEVCATFLTTSTISRYNSYRSSAQTDNYVDDTYFYTPASGYRCFEFKSSPLQNDFWMTRPGDTAY